MAELIPAATRIPMPGGPEGAEYVAICLPAFAPDLARRDPTVEAVGPGPAGSTDRDNQ